MIDSPLRSRKSLALGALICIHIVVCCVSLLDVAGGLPGSYNPAQFHIFYHPSELRGAVAAVTAFAPVALLFVIARFSFGYLIGFFLYTMILGFLWLGRLTDLVYDHRTAELSAAASAIAFLLPCLLITSPIRQRYVLSTAAFDRLLIAIVLLGVATIVAGATYNFQFVGIEQIYEYRDKLGLPPALGYAIGMSSSALLPFAFAGFIARKAYLRAAAVLPLLVLFYPITLSKLGLFAPLWLVAILLLSKLFEARIAVVLSLLVPIAAGLLLINLPPANGVRYLYFSVVNFRMVAIPSVAMDVYNDFFAKHDHTWFCQISFLKHVMTCPYQDPLSIVMERAYKLGNFNASLFATEGVASVGSWLAPVSAFLCGLVFALANRLSAGLPAGFILVSGAVIPQVLLNVPLTTALLTHGAGLLFLLWYVTPRAIFEPAPVAQPAAPGPGNGRR
jgi:hypothetical protein